MSMDNTVVEWRWWRRVGLIALQEDCQCQDIIQFFNQKARTDFLYYWDYVVGTGLSEVSVGYFVLVS